MSTNQQGNKTRDNGKGKIITVIFGLTLAAMATAFLPAKATTSQAQQTSTVGEFLREDAEREAEKKAREERRALSEQRAAQRKAETLQQEQQQLEEQRAEAERIEAERLEAERQEILAIEYAAALQQAQQQEQQRQAATTTTTPPVTNPPPPAPAVSSNSVWDNLAWCESRGNWNMNSGNGFYGGLQFMLSTWLNMGGGQYSYYPHEATREQQIEVASRLQAQYGWGQWPACSSALGLR